jgi:hypothetical protein
VSTGCTFDDKDISAKCVVRPSCYINTNVFPNTTAISFSATCPP